MSLQILKSEFDRRKGKQEQLQSNFEKVKQEIRKGKKKLINEEKAFKNK